MDGLRIEFHCHTLFSKDSLTQPETLVRTARRKGLDRVVVTDHNTIQGALEAQRIDPELVIVGEEIMTTCGEILASFMTEKIPARLTPQETIRRLRDQGAFISVSHPFDIFRSGSWDLDDLLEILPLVDAIEVFNARCMWPGFNSKAKALARQYDLPGTVGSDAHAEHELGLAYLIAPHFTGADGLRAVIRRAKTVTHLSSPLVHLMSRYAALQKRKTKNLDTSKGA
jgi:predicted metal-dependent phosphoesterase TrpH